MTIEPKTVKLINREESNLSLRNVASNIDINTSLLAKIERNERQPTKEQVEKFANFFKLDISKLTTAWLSDKIAYSLIGELNPKEVLKVAEEKIKYLRAHHG